MKIKLIQCCKRSLLLDSTIILNCYSVSDWSRRIKSYRKRQKFVKWDNPHPSLIHVPLGLPAALQNAAPGHSGNHLFPAEHRVCRKPGSQICEESWLSASTGACREISPLPPSSYQWCHMKRRSAEYQHQLNNIGNGTRERVELVQGYHSETSENKQFTFWKGFLRTSIGKI